MPLLPFQGTAWALSGDRLAAVASNLGVFAPEIWTVLAVETSGCGYFPTGARNSLSAILPGGYGRRGAHQYDRLNRAIAGNRNADLQSPSWGIGQLMGEKCAAAGFTGVEEMVTAMSQSEDQQLAPMGRFLTSAKLRVSLQAHDWTTFARRYKWSELRHQSIRRSSECQVPEIFLGIAAGSQCSRSAVVSYLSGF
jgi:hypothetical protein